MTNRSGTGLAGQRRRNKIDGMFVALLGDMLESAAWRVLSLSARRVLERIEIELLHHGRYCGKGLCVTYDNLQAHGIERHRIAPAIREARALGFLRITQKGRAGNAEFRRPQLYQLTYLNTNDIEPTHDWKKIKTLDDAKAAKQAAKTAADKNTKPVRKTPPTSVRISRTENPSPPRCAKSALQAVGEMRTTSHISMGRAVGGRQVAYADTANLASAATTGNQQLVRTRRPPLGVRYDDRLARGRKPLHSLSPNGGRQT